MVARSYACLAALGELRVRLKRSIQTHLVLRSLFDLQRDLHSLTATVLLAPPQNHCYR